MRTERACARRGRGPTTPRSSSTRRRRPARSCSIRTESSAPIPIACPRNRSSPRASSSSTIWGCRAWCARLGSRGERASPSWPIWRRAQGPLFGELLALVDHLILPWDVAVAMTGASTGPRPHAPCGMRVRIRRHGAAGRRGRDARHRGIVVHERGAAGRGLPPALVPRADRRHDRLRRRVPRRLCRGPARGASGGGAPALRVGGRRAEGDARRRSEGNPHSRRRPRGSSWIGAARREECGHDPQPVVRGARVAGGGAGQASGRDASGREARLRPRPTGQGDVPARPLRAQGRRPQPGGALRRPHRVPVPRVPVRLHGPGQAHPRQREERSRRGALPRRLLPRAENHGFVFIWWGENPPDDLAEPFFFDDIDEGFTLRHDRRPLERPLFPGHREPAGRRARALRARGHDRPREARRS